MMRRCSALRGSRGPASRDCRWDAFLMVLTVQASSPAHGERVVSRGGAKLSASLISQTRPADRRRVWLGNNRPGMAELGVSLSVWAGRTLNPCTFTSLIWLGFKDPFGRPPLFPERVSCIDDEIGVFNDEVVVDAGVVGCDQYTIELFDVCWGEWDAAHVRDVVFAHGLCDGDMGIVVLDLCASFFE